MNDMKFTTAGEYMKDRIDQLIDEATTNILGIKVLDKRMFADLIIDECINVCNAIELNANLTNNISDGAMLCRIEIKKHFGVE